MDITIIVTVEPKDEFSGGEGSLPLPGEVAAALLDSAIHETKDDYCLPWRVTDVRET